MNYIVFQHHVSTHSHKLHCFVLTRETTLLCDTEEIPNLINLFEYNTLTRTQFRTDGTLCLSSSWLSSAYRLNPLWPSDAIWRRQHVVLKPNIFHYERITSNLRCRDFLERRHHCILESIAKIAHFYILTLPWVGGWGGHFVNKIQKHHIFQRLWGENRL